jgi:hypothetical protein
MKINLNTPFPSFPQGGRRLSSLPLGGDLEGVIMKRIKNKK